MGSLLFCQRIRPFRIESRRFYSMKRTRTRHSVLIRVLRVCLCFFNQFCKIDAEKSPFLVERLQIVVLPTILCIKDGKTVHQIVGFDEFGVRDLSDRRTTAIMRVWNACFIPYPRLSYLFLSRSIFLLFKLPPPNHTLHLPTGRGLLPGVHHGVRVVVARSAQLRRATPRRGGRGHGGQHERPQLDRHAEEQHPGRRYRARRVRR